MGKMDEKKVAKTMAFISVLSLFHVQEYLFGDATYK